MTASRQLSGALARTSAALWASTGLGALAGLAGVNASTGTPHDALTAKLDTFVELLTHNLAVALWPLALAALGWAARPAGRRAADALVTVQLAGHGLLVGAALTEHPELWRYLPHLPLEWLGIACGAAAWLHARAGTPSRQVLLRSAAGTVAALIAAAALETWTVPL